MNSCCIRMQYCYKTQEEFTADLISYKAIHSSTQNSSRRFRHQINLPEIPLNHTILKNRRWEARQGRNRKGEVEGKREGRKRGRKEGRKMGREGKGRGRGEQRGGEGEEGRDETGESRYIVIFCTYHILDIWETTELLPENIYLIIHFILLG